MLDGVTGNERFAFSHSALERDKDLLPLPTNISKECVPCFSNVDYNTYIVGTSGMCYVNHSYAHAGCNCNRSTATLQIKDTN